MSLLDPALLLRSKFPEHFTKMTAKLAISLAEKRANDAEAALKRVTHAIRTQLPTSHEVAATK